MQLNVMLKVKYFDYYNTVVKCFDYYNTVTTTKIINV